ncbi:Histidine ammonia-lyase [bioreactor metagenome]|uniref:Histidine ammonia-lyase n=1 Tax=bioreactor metagenome TaxID=1076179 RepID=A0A645JNK7_9ZZZZ
MEIMCACQGIDLRGNKGLGDGTEPAYKAVRKCVPMLEDDRPLYEDINKCENLIIDNTLIQEVEKSL